MRNMNCKQLWIIFFVVLVFSTQTPAAFAQSVEIISEGVYQMGDNDTPSAAEEMALLKAKRNAVEQAGTYIGSFTSVKNFQVTDDNVVALSVGAIKVSVLDTKRTQIGNGMEIRVKIRAIVDTEMLNTLIKKLYTVEKSTTITKLESQPATVGIDTGIIKLNGLYQAVSYHGQGHYYYYYYRFFPNGRVSSYFSPLDDRVSDVYKALEISSSGNGNYSVQNGEIKFSLIFPKGNIDYTGKMIENKLRLVFHSNIINTDGGYDCKFIEVN